MLQAKTQHGAAAVPAHGAVQGAVAGCCFRVLLQGAVGGAGAQSLACFLLFGIYAGVFLGFAGAQRAALA